MSGSALRSAIVSGFVWDVNRILEGASDVSLMRSPIGTGMQSGTWVRRKSPQHIIADRDHLGNTSLHVSVANSRPECLEILLGVEGTDPNIPGQGGYSPAVVACDRNEVKCLRMLLEAGIDVNQQDEVGWSLLHHAAAAGSLSAIEVLLERELPGTEIPIIVDLVNYNGHSPCMLACINNDVEVIEKLVLAGADPWRKHKDTNTSAFEMCGSDAAREICISAMERRKAVLEQREKEETERREKEAFRASLQRKALEGSNDEEDN